MADMTWPKQRKIMFYTMIVCMAFVPAMVAMEFVFADLVVRHVAMSAMGIALALAISALLINTRNEPKRWKHVYKPIRYDTAEVTKILNQLDREVDRGTWSGYQERTRGSLWLREAIAEYVELTWTGSIYDFDRMMSMPEKSPYLNDKPALKKMISDMQDLGVYKDGSFLLFPRRKFLKVVDLMFQEVKAP